ncbi:MAG TPA: hypothetical protein VLA96_03235 [Terriglobales bacterium]|jgi:hypothetical protein|nr:hypothetical protein [Terriglobales bacterium]
MDLRLALRLILYAGLFFELLIAGTLLYRRLYRRLPLFFLYASFALLMTLTLQGTRRVGPSAYFYSYWGFEVVSWALELAVIQEVMQQLFEPYSSIRRLVLLLFRWGAGLLVTIALLSAIAAPGGDTDQLMAGVLTLERSVRIVEVGLLSLLFVFAGFLRLRWPHYALGIALGFGIYCTVELVTLTARAHGGMTMQTSFFWMKPLAFVVAQVCWASYFLLPARVPASERTPAPTMQGWDSALAEFLRR